MNCQFLVRSATRALLLSLLIVVACHGAEGDEDRTGDSTPEEALKPFDDLRSDSPSPRHHQRAELLFRLGRYPEAVADYSVAARGGEPHDENSCWERGLALYYAGDYAGGAAQFERYHQVGATDVENGLWQFLCLAEADSVEKARAGMVSYSRMRGAPFPALWALYKGEGSEVAVMASVEADSPSAEARRERLFYAHYYVGKYLEATGDLAQAKVEIDAALQQALPFFMDSCAREDLRRLEERLKGETKE